MKSSKNSWNAENVIELMEEDTSLRSNYDRLLSSTKSTKPEKPALRKPALRKPVPKKPAPKSAPKRKSSAKELAEVTKWVKTEKKPEKPRKAKENSKKWYPLRRLSEMYKDGRTILIYTISGVIYACHWCPLRERWGINGDYFRYIPNEMISLWQPVDAPRTSNVK